MYNLRLGLDMSFTDGIFENGAYGVPRKSQNPSILGQGGPSSTQCSNPSYSDDSIKNTVLRPNRQYKASTAEMAEYRYS